MKASPSSDQSRLVSGDRLPRPRVLLGVAPEQLVSIRRVERITVPRECSFPRKTGHLLQTQVFFSWYRLVL